MARIPRLLNCGESTIYHVMSRTALDGYPLGDIEKDILLALIQKFSRFYLVETIGFCIMGNHFHLLCKVLPHRYFSDQEIQQRVEDHYPERGKISDDKLLKFREKLSNLSEFMREIKQEFTRYYNKQHNRRGFFWGQRYKSVIVEKGESLLNCLAYIDLNPIRANLCELPEDYRWNSLGYLLQTDNKDNFLSLEFGLYGEEKMDLPQGIKKYRQFIYEIGSMESLKGASINEKLLHKERKKGFKITRLDRFKHRTRYFSDSGVIGSKKFVSENFLRFRESFISKREKTPVPIQGLEGCYSLKGLAFFGT